MAHMHDRLVVPEKLREQLARHDLTIRGLEQRCATLGLPVSYTHLKGVLAGTRVVSDRYAERIAAGLGVTVEAFTVRKSAASRPVPHASRVA